MSSPRNRRHQRTQGNTTHSTTDKPLHSTLIGPWPAAAGAACSCNAMWCGVARLYFSHVRPKHQKSFFINIEGLRKCWRKLSYGAPRWALVIRLTQNERPKSPPQKRYFIRKPGLWDHFCRFWKTMAFGSFWPAIFRARVDTLKNKSHLGSCLNQRDRATCGFV